jgi:hypothetical protein
MRVVFFVPPFLSPCSIEKVAVQEKTHHAILTGGLDSSIMAVASGN